MAPKIQSLACATLLTLAIAVPAQAQQSPHNGVVRVKSAYSMEESVTRVKADIAAKGITFFNEIDQSALAAKNGITNRDAQFNMATQVVGSITSTLKAAP